MRAPFRIINFCCGQASLNRETEKRKECPDKTIICCERVLLHNDEERKSVSLRHTFLCYL